MEFNKEEIFSTINELFEELMEYPYFKTFLTTRKSRDFFAFVRKFNEQSNFGENELIDYLTIESGCSKVVFLLDGIDWVVKIPFSNCRSFKEENYCALEAKYYAEARDCNLEQFFAPCYFIGKHKTGCPLYIMEKVNCDSDEVEDNLIELMEENGLSTEDALDKFNTLSDEGLVIEEIFGYYYDLEEVSRLWDFCTERDINDLHSANVGYKEANFGRTIVLTDYSGY